MQRSKWAATFWNEHCNYSKSTRCKINNNLRTNLNDSGAGAHSCNLSCILAGYQFRLGAIMILAGPVWPRVSNGQTEHGNRGDTRLNSPLNPVLQAQLGTFMWKAMFFFIFKHVARTCGPRLLYTKNKTRTQTTAPLRRYSANTSEM